MKKSKLLSVLLSAFFTVSVLAFSACDFNGLIEDVSGIFKGEETVEKVEIFGFDVEESITVDAGTSVLVDIPIVTDGNGNPVDVVYEVTNSVGGVVGVTANRFFAVDEKGYFINYAVLTADGVIHKKTTEVKVKGNSTLYAEYEVMVDQGAETQIVPVSDFTEPTYSYVVTHKATGTVVPVTDGKFVTEELGFYTVKITATEDETTAEYEYEIYCREKMQEGEVERFDSAWGQVRTLSGLDTFGWEVVNTAETGIRDRFGREADFAKLVTSAEYGYLWINPRGDEDYYRQLAQEGYTHVSFWIYSAGNVNHDVMSQLYPDKGAYTSNIGKVSPKTWTEIKIRLVETHNDYSGSFASAVDYFKKQQTHVLCFDNAAGWNSGGHENNMTIYVSDIYAVKSADIKVADGAQTDYVTGDTVNFEDIVSVPEGIDVQYNVQFRDSSELLTESEYTFKANGLYTLNVIPTPNISSSAKIALNVTDGVVSNVSDRQIERTEDSVTVDFSTLNVELTNGGQPVAVKGYKIYRYGEEVATNSSTFTTSVDGGYTLEIEGEYDVDGQTYKTYTNMILDVWSNDSKYVVTYNDLMLAHSEYCGWNNWDKHPTYQSGMYAVGGESGRMLRVNKLGQTFLVMFKPMYSKGYYEMVLAENPTATVTLKYYVLSDVGGGSIRSYFDGFESKGFARNQWVVDTITLAEFVETYDKMSTGYDEVKYLMDYNITETHSRSEQDFLFWFSGDSRGDIVYVPDIMITLEASEGTVALKENTELLVDEINDLTAMFDVTLDGKPAEMVTVDVKYGNSWIALPEKTFNPSFNGEYTFRIYATSGSAYKTVEYTVATSGEELVRTDDTKLYVLKNGETFDLTNFGKDGYDLEYTVERVIGGSLEEVNVKIDSAALTAEALQETGNYKITVTLVADEDSVFGKFVYYTLFVNYVGENAEYAVVSVNGAKYAKAWNNWNSSSVPYVTAVVADSTDANLTGKSGQFFKADIKPRWAKDADEVGVQILPLYSKAYYESLLADGKSYNFSFEWSYVSTYEYATPLTSFRSRVFGATSDNYSTVPGAWYKETISLQKLLDNWDTLVSEGKSNTRNLRELVYIRVSGGNAHNTVVGSMYIGNFQLVKAGVVETGVKLVDTVGATTFDLTSVYEDAIASATYTAVLTDSYGNQTDVANAKVFDVTSVKQGVYTMTLSENGNVAYTVSIDFYDSSEGVVWQEIDENSVKDAWVWKHGYNKIGAANFSTIGEENVLQFTVTLATESNTNAVGLRLKAIHSYEYYQAMAQTYEAITVGVYITGGGLNLEVFDDANGDGVNDTARGVWQAKGKWVSYAIPMQFLLDNWLTLNNLTDEAKNADCSLFVQTYYG